MVGVRDIADGCREKKRNLVENNPTCGLSQMNDTKTHLLKRP